MYDDDEDEFVCDKFDDCGMCKNRFKEDVCETCDVGEEFEEEDPDEVDVGFVGRL